MYKLIKTEKQYVLQNKKGIVIATSLEDGKLSLKNCQVIENGYYLDELTDLRANILNSYTSGTKWVDDIDKLLTRYKEVIELMYDKKFNNGNIHNIGNITQDFEFKKLIKDLQKTVWDVEIEMQPSIGISDKYTPDNYPKLDDNDCLILKKI